MQQIKLSLHLKLTAIQHVIKTKPGGFLCLPPPVLIRIAVFLELRFRLSFAFASAKVKHALFSAPQLWNKAYPSFDIRTSEESLPRVLAGLMKRARASDFYPTLPLYYTAAIEGDNLLVADDPHRVLYACQTVFREASSITLVLDSGRNKFGIMVDPPPPPPWSCICSKILILPSPRLESLSISAVDSPILEPDPLGRYLPSNMLGSDPGALTTLSLRDVSLLGANGAASPLTIPALSNLRTLNYVALYSTLEERELRFILAALPTLENLGLGFRYFQPQPDCDTVGLPANRIRRLVLTGFSRGDIELLNVFNHAVSIRAEFSAERKKAQHFAHWIDCDDVHVRIRAQSMMIVGRNDGRDFEFFSSWAHAEMELSPLAVIADRVTSLTLQEGPWAEAINRLLDLVSLKDLGIVLKSCFEISSIRGIFMWSPAEGKPAAKFPALESLRFLARDSKYGKCHQLQDWSPCLCRCTLSLRDVLSFMHHILLPGQRVRRVILHRISAIVDVDLAGAICDLFRIAEDLEVRSDVPAGTAFAFGIHESWDPWPSCFPANMPEAPEDLSFFWLPPQVRFDGTLPPA